MLSSLSLLSLSVSLSDQGFCVGVGDIVLECCCCRTDVSVMQSVFPVRERERERVVQRGREVKRERERQELRKALNDTHC